MQFIYIVSELRIGWCSLDQSRFWGQPRMLGSIWEGTWVHFSKMFCLSFHFTILGTGVQVLVTIMSKFLFIHME